MVTHINSVVAPSIALLRCLYMKLKNYKVNMLSIVLLLPFFSTICIVCNV